MRDTVQSQLAVESIMVSGTTAHITLYGESRKIRIAPVVVVDDNGERVTVQYRPTEHDRNNRTLYTRRGELVHIEGAKRA